MISLLVMPSPLQKNKSSFFCILCIASELPLYENESFKVRQVIFNSVSPAVKRPKDRWVLMSLQLKAMEKFFSSQTRPPVILVTYIVYCLSGALSPLVMSEISSRILA